MLHFYLAGINNQNFLMRDKETGTWWQQITGKAISGPMKGAALSLVLSDEVTFGEWKSELPSAADGKVLAEVAKYGKEYDSNWEAEVAKYPAPFSVAGAPLKARDVVVGLQIDGPGRAYPWDALVKQSPVEDHVHGVPLLVAVGPDGKSFRVFISRIDGKDAEFFLKGERRGLRRSLPALGRRPLERRALRRRAKQLRRRNLTLPRLRQLLQRRSRPRQSRRSRGFCSTRRRLVSGTFRDAPSRVRRSGNAWIGCRR